MFSKNISTFLLHLIKDRRIQLNLADEITRDTLLTRDGELVNARLRELLQLEPLPTPATDQPTKQEG
jgi:NAD(P) transhydrogenase subunit alpha